MSALRLRRPPESDVSATRALVTHPTTKDEAASPEAHAILEVRDLRTQFRTASGELRAVDGVSLSLVAGKTLGIVGESGSGKTVLIRSIMGLLPREGVSRSGQVLLAGRDLLACSERDLRRVWGAEIAMVFQDPMSSLNPVRKIGAQLGAPLRRHLGLKGRAAREAAEGLLRSVGLSEPEHRLSQYPHELSGGMRQRVMIAIALACGPHILLADEPTTALDVTVQKQILNLLDQQQQARRMGIILVTHDLGVVAAHSDDVIVMYAGKVVERAATATLFRQARMPYTEALFRAMPRMADRSHTPIPPLAGNPPDLRRLPVGCSFAPRCKYVRDRCRREAPPLAPQPHDPAHLVACWYPIDVQAPSHASRAPRERFPEAATPEAAPAPKGRSV